MRMPKQPGAPQSQSHGCI